MIKELDTWDMDCITIPDGYNNRSVPDLTRNNIEVLMDKMNEIIKEINK